MKILHTGDWHLGHTLYNYERTEEQAAMIRQMVDIVKEHCPDVFLVCGDVFHTSQPASAVQTMFSEALLQIGDAHPDMTIVVTAGNHDSATKHETHRAPWKRLKVHTIGTLNKTDFDEHIIPIPGKGYIIAIPYANERNIPEGFFQAILDEVAERNTEHLPVVMTAHTTVQGCDFTGHERSNEYTVGGIDSLSIEQMGEGYDYLALGHIHHEQFVHTGRHNVRYSGTPIAVSFDENYPHSVSLVEVERHGSTPKVEKIEITNPHPLVTLPTQGMASLDDALQLLRDFPDDYPAYIRLNVEVDDFLPVGANDEAQRIAEAKACRFCLINAKRKAVERAETKAMTVQEFQREAPIDIARRYANDTGKAFDDDMKQLFNEVLQLIENDLRNN